MIPIRPPAALLDRDTRAGGRRGPVFLTRKTWNIRAGIQGGDVVDGLGDDLGLTVLAHQSMIVSDHIEAFVLVLQFGPVAQGTN